MVGEPIRVHRLGRRCRGRGARARAARDGRALGRARRRYPHELSRRPAPAGGDRARARGGSAAHGRRRGGLGARRLGARPDPEPLRGPARAARSRLPLRLPRPGRDPLREPSGGRDVPGPARGGRARRALFERPLHPYTQALPRGDPDHRRRKRPRSSISPRGSCRASCRARSTCPAGAGSRAAARIASTAARSEPRLLEAEPGHVVACHLYTEGGSTMKSREGFEVVNQLRSAR